MVLIFVPCRSVQSLQDNLFEVVQKLQFFPRTAANLQNNKFSFQRTFQVQPVPLLFTQLERDIQYTDEGNCSTVMLICYPYTMPYSLNIFPVGITGGN